MKDQFNRHIDYVRISITDKCNLRCIYCMPGEKAAPSGRGEALTIDEIKRFVAIVSRYGLRKVRLTGGEPLLRKDLPELISALKGIGVRELSMTTNGILLAGAADNLKKAGLDRVNISLDTMKPGRYDRVTNGGDIKRVWESIEASENAGLKPVKINVVPIRGINDDEIVSFARLSIEKDYHIRFIEFMPTAANGLWSRERSIPSSEILKKLSVLGKPEKLRFRGRGPSRNFRIRGGAGIIGVISPISDHFCGHCNRMRLTARGRLRPCLFSSHEIDIRGPMRRGMKDTEIERLFREAVASKPPGHNLGQGRLPEAPGTSMSQIGG